ncbi:MAG TPA: hypothetical protein VJV79_23995 [Polyangiaceae bacterium]|nr:hypothetical protein [Polyangiaceae bacterium]
MNWQPWRRVVRSALQVPTDLTWKDWLEYALLAAISVVAWVHARSYAGAIIDDAFITFRHSWNLIHGRGLSYNPAERVEGTSSLLFSVLMAIPIALGADPYRCAGLLGRFALVACAVAAYASVRACVRDGSRRALALGAAAIVACSSELAFHSQTGMETLLYASLIAAGLALQLASSAKQQPTPTWATVFGLAALTRPEGWVLFLLAFAVGCLGRGSAPGVQAIAKRELTRFAWLFLPVLAFRLVYFGSWLPNTVLAKGGHLGWLFHTPGRAALERLLHGPSASLLEGYVRSHPVASSLLLGTILLQRTRQAGLTALSFTLACAALALWSDGDWMPYDRLLTPCVVPLAVGAVLGLRGLFFHREQLSRLGHLPSYAFSGLALAAISAAAHTRLDIEKVSWVSLARLRAMGERLAPLAREDELVATEYAGILPYYWRAPTLDMLGLCDPHIARHGAPQPLGAGRKDLTYVVAQRPTFYAFNLASEAAIFYSEPAFASQRDEYALLQFPYRFLEPLQALPLTVFVRKDRKDVEGLARAVGGQLIDPALELKRLGYLR